MSDLVDRAQACDTVSAQGATFRSRAGYVTPRSRTLEPCSCGGRPQYNPHPPLRKGGDLLETLKCSACGNYVGPFSSRAALALAWRMGGSDATHKNSVQTPR